MSGRSVAAAWRWTPWRTSPAPPCRAQVPVGQRHLLQSHRARPHGRPVLQPGLWYPSPRRLPPPRLACGRGAACPGGFLADAHVCRSWQQRGRLAAHIKLENYGSAIEDATKAIELDPTYVKVTWGTFSWPTRAAFSRRASFPSRDRRTTDEAALISPFASSRRAWLTSERSILIHSLTWCRI